jgi:hypothetical protein
MALGFRIELEIEKMAEDFGAISLSTRSSSKPHPLLIVLAFLWTQCDLGSLNQKCRVLSFCQCMSLAF